MQRTYGEKVQVDYIDTTRNPLDDLSLVSQVVQMGYSFPIIAINGQPRMAGGIDVHQIKKLLDEM